MNHVVRQRFTFDGIYLLLGPVPNIFAYQMKNS